MNVGDATLGDINVAVMEGFRQDGYVISKLRVRRDGQERMINHYWFDSWPDHGVPKNLATVWSMLKAVRAHSNPTENPWIVHCSAGIGRTGTFLAIDHGIQHLDDSGVADVISIVKALRQDRGGMVQHAEQAEFAHRVLVKYAETYGAPPGEKPSGSSVLLLDDEQVHPITEESVARAHGCVPPDFTIHPSQLDTHEGAEVDLFYLSILFNL